MQRLLADEVDLFASIDELRAAADGLRDVDDTPPSIARLVEQLDKLVAHEAIPDPDEMAQATLLDLRPKFLWFDETWRSLESQFDVIETAPQPATKALLGLVHLEPAGAEGRSPPQ